MKSVSILKNTNASSVVEVKIRNAQGQWNSVWKVQATNSSTGRIETPNIPVSSCHQAKIICSFGC